MVEAVKGFLAAFLSLPYFSVVLCDVKLLPHATYLPCAIVLLVMLLCMCRSFWCAVFVM